MTHPEPGSRAFSWLTAAAAVVFAVILGFSRLSYGLLLPAIRTELGGDYATLGLIGTANFIGYLLGTLATPALARYARARVALWSGLALAALLIGSATANDLLGLGIWRLIVGFASAPVTVVTLALTLDRVRPAERGLAAGLVWGGGAVGIALSGLLAPYVLGAGAAGGWRWTWVGMGVCGVCGALWFALLLRRVPAQAAAGATTATPIARVIGAFFDPRRLLFLMLAYVCFGCGYIIYFTFIVSWLVTQGLAAQSAGFAWAAIGVAGAVSGVLWGRAVDRWPTGKTMALALAIGALGAAAVITQRIGLAVIGGALVGLCAFIAPPLLVTALLRRAVRGADYTASFSVLTACFAAGQILGPVLGGAVIERAGLPAGVAVSGLVLGIGALFAWHYSAPPAASEG